MTTKTVRGMEDKERLSELGSFSLEKETIFIFLNGVIKKMRIDSSDLHTERMRLSGHKLQQGQFQVNTRKKKISQLSW